MRKNWEMKKLNNTTQDREGHDLAAICMICLHWPSLWLWYLLPDPLMRPGSVKVLHIGNEHPVELLLLQDEQMIEAFTPHACEKSFTGRIRSRSVIWYVEHLV
jgi:hypothetical protein